MSVCVYIYLESIGNLALILLVSGYILSVFYFENDICK